MTASVNLDNLELTDDPEIQNAVFKAAFNSGRVEVFDGLYREDSISNLSGVPLSGDARREAAAQILASGPKIDPKIRYAHRAGDVSLVVVDFTLDITGPDGQPVRLTGSCTDVLRRDPDGTWYMSVDRPVLDQELPW
ncbi:YybH family protein [Saccharothrix deserti]|uniref:YybH family protein n=1 Tax=Saccharothrix deserti TaxID=2593674 RepID=UPI00131AA4D4|nr:DUF4440 domain-containing protein [Saccharothrix deserti]